MKYIKKYKVFESIHPLNTNIKELDSNFISDITDICADLNDQFPQTDPDGDLVKFYSPYFRAKLKEEPFPEYPSISINMPWFPYGYTFGGKDLKHKISKDCDELKEVALRIKEFLGDAYIGFVIGGGKSFNLSDNTTLYSGINGFQIVYDQNKIS
jgi:hypothetical protein